MDKASDAFEGVEWFGALAALPQRLAGRGTELAHAPGIGRAAVRTGGLRIL
jgi:hypothetical protein